MKITKEWLAEKNACQDGYNWFTKQNKEFEPVPLLYLLIKKNQLNWANWLIVRVMEYKQYVSYAVFAAELVIDIFEKKYPDDKHPREAIEAAKKCIKNPNDENKKEAGSAGRAACSAADSASLAAWSASSAEWGAYSATDWAAWAAYSAADSAADSAEWGAVNAADSAADRSAYRAARAAKSAKILKKILKYGIKLLTGGNNENSY